MNSLTVAPDATIDVVTDWLVWGVVVGSFHDGKGDIVRPV